MSSTTLLMSSGTPLDCARQTNQQPVARHLTALVPGRRKHTPRNPVPMHHSADDAIRFLCTTHKNSSATDQLKAVGPRVMRETPNCDILVGRGAPHFRCGASTRWTRALLLDERLELL